MWVYTCLTDFSLTPLQLLLHLLGRDSIRLYPSMEGHHQHFMMSHNSQNSSANPQPVYICLVKKKILNTCVAGSADVKIIPLGLVLNINDGPVVFKCPARLDKRNMTLKLKQLNSAITHFLNYTNVFGCFSDNTCSGHWFIHYL